MDFVAVLRDPKNPLGEAEIRRLRIQLRRLTIERFLLFGLLLVSFVSQLILHVQVMELRSDQDTVEQKIEDIIAAKKIVFNYNNMEAHSLSESSDNVKSRMQRTLNTVILPHFELTGTGYCVQGIFRWNSSTLGNGFRQVPSSGYTEKIQILQTGMYRLHAKVAINGRNIQYPHWGDRDPSSRRRQIELMNPAVGLFLKKTSRRSGTTIIDQAWKTQDGRGIDRYSSSIEPRDDRVSKAYPMDTIEVSGSFLLEENDLIYVQTADDMRNHPNNERFFNDDLNARFEGQRFA